MFAEVIGCALVVGACTWMGVDGASRLKKRVKTLSEIIVSLELMRGEICTRLTPMPELMSILALDGPAATRGFFSRVLEGLALLGQRTMNGIWTDAVESSPELSLKDDEARALAELGSSLGRYGTHEQELAIDRCIAEFEGFRISARAAYSKDGRLYTGLGLAGGCILAVILV